VVRALRFIEQRIHALIEIRDADDIAVRMEQRDGSGLRQDDIDAMLTLREAKPPVATRSEAAAPAALFG
jgi:hypothetical protein